MAKRSMMMRRPLFSSSSKKSPSQAKPPEGGPPTLPMVAAASPGEEAGEELSLLSTNAPSQGLEGSQGLDGSSAMASRAISAFDDSYLSDFAEDSMQLLSGMSLYEDGSQNRPHTVPSTAPTTADDALRTLSRNMLSGSPNEIIVERRPDSVNSRPHSVSAISSEGRYDAYGGCLGSARPSTTWRPVVAAGGVSNRGATTILRGGPGGIRKRPVVSDLGSPGAAILPRR